MNVWGTPAVYSHFCRYPHETFLNKTFIQYAAAHCNMQYKAQIVHDFFLTNLDNFVTDFGVSFTQIESDYSRRERFGTHSPALQKHGYSLKIF